MCIQCTADVFPFNHYNDDTDFYWSLYMFFQLNQNVDLQKIQRLCVNPRDMNNILQTKFLEDVLNESFDDVHHVTWRK